MSAQAFSKIGFYFQYPFVQYAFVVGILIGVVSSLLGNVLILRRFSFIGDGLSHSAFGAMALAGALGIMNKMLVVMPIIAIFSIFLLKGGGKSNNHGDAHLAILSSSSLAVGYLIMNLFPQTSNISSDVCSSLFGSMQLLTLDRVELWVCLIFSFAIVALFVLFYNKIFSVTFDESFAKASGVKSSAINMLIALLISVIISLSMKLVGSLLISALVVFPSLSAMKIFKTFKSVTISSCAISVFCVVAGLILSILLNLPTGASIVIVNLIIFILSSLASRTAPSF